MRWALQWLTGWLFLLWAIDDVRQSTRAAPPSVATAAVASRGAPNGHGPSTHVRVESAASGLHVDRLGVLLLHRRQEPDVYEVEVPDGWPDAVKRCHAVVPAFRNGRAYGLKLFGLRRDEEHRLGLRTQDVVLQVNDIRLAGPAAMSELQVELRRARRLDVQLERDGHLVKKTYRLSRAPGELR